jgi:hypothetical protein
MKKYLIWGILFVIMAVTMFIYSIESLSGKEYFDSVLYLLLALGDGFMSWDAFSNYKKNKQI